jgi:hypothetical protein
MHYNLDDTRSYRRLGEQLIADYCIFLQYGFITHPPHRMKEILLISLFVQRLAVFSFFWVSSSSMSESDSSSDIVK